MSRLLLRISSPSSYKLMRKMNILPLPTPTRPRHIIKGMPSEFGFNKASLSSTRAFMQGKKEVDRYGTLTLDEMKICQAVAFNKTTYKVDGFVNYGENEGSAIPADHALVRLFVPLFHSVSWAQPIASFCWQWASPGRVLARLVLEAIVQLHKQNTIALAVDGTATNKAM